MKDKISLPPKVNDAIIRKFAMYCSERLGMDDYHLVKIATLVITGIKASVGIDELKNILKKENLDYDSVVNRIDYFDKILIKMEQNYAAIQNKKFEKDLTHKDVVLQQKQFNKNFINVATKLSFKHKLELYDLTFTLLGFTTAMIRSIPSEAYKQLEHQKIIKMEMKKETQKPI